MINESVLFCPDLRKQIYSSDRDDGAQAETVKCQPFYGCAASFWVEFIVRTRTRSGV